MHYWLATWKCRFDPSLSDWDHFLLPTSDLYVAALLIQITVQRAGELISLEIVG